MTSVPSSRDETSPATDGGNTGSVDPDGAADICAGAGLGRIIKRGRPSVAEAQRLPDQILDAGWEVLLDSGFDGFTFDRLARHARVGKATIYSRYPNKRAFLVALVDYYLENRRAQILSEGRDGSLIEVFCRQAAQVLDMLFSADGILFERLLDWLDQEGGADDSGVRGQSYAQAIQSIEQSLQEAVSRGEARIVDIPRAARFWLEGMIGHARLAGSQGRKSAADNAQWARDYTEFFFRGNG